MPIIKNWIILGGPGNYYILGEIYNDSRADDGETIRTSRIKILNLNAGTLETLNTKYELGPEADGTKVMNQNTQFID